VGTVPKKRYSGTSCATCYTGDLHALIAEAEIKTKGDGQIGQDVSGHIENPAGQLQSVDAPTAVDYGWYLHYLGVDEIGPGDVSLISPVLIGVIDSGVDTGDNDLKPFFWSTPSALADVRWTAGAIGYDFLRMNTDPWDEMPISHGTHVSGLLVGQQISRWLPPVSQSLTGKLKLVELKVAGSHGTLDSATAQNAVLGGIGKGIHLFNLSFELGAYSEMLRNYLADAGRSSNSLYVVAAGNNGAIGHGESLDSNIQRHMTFRRDDSLPLPDVMFVAALGRDGKLAVFSNFGQKTVEIAAPGADISSTIRNGGHGLLSGTSQAAPFVTLTAAILMAEFPSMSLPEVHQRIVDTCDWVTELKPFVRDGCRLNIEKAVTKNTDLVELKSGKILKGAVSPAQITLPAGSSAAGAKYERAWFADDGTITIATTNGRFPIPSLSASSLLLTVQSAADCVGQMTGTDCAVPVNQVRDVVFRASVQ
jgi:subtilisin family serine protease